MAVKIPYVVKRGNIYHFRIAIPKQVQAPRDLPTEHTASPLALPRSTINFLLLAFAGASEACGERCCGRPGPV